MKTQSFKKEDTQHNWVIVDATDKVLGRLASKIADKLRGKDKPIFTPHVDCGDHVIVINAEKVKLTGNKLTQKEYVRHTGFPGGQRISTPEELFKKKPTDVIEKAVKGMLPKNKLGRQLFHNLHVYAGTEHDHGAQKPTELKTLGLMKF